MKKNLILFLLILLFTNTVFSQEVLDKFTSKKWGFAISYPYEKTKKKINFENDSLLEFSISRYNRGYNEIVEVIVTKHEDANRALNNYTSKTGEIDNTKLNQGYTIVDSLFMEIDNKENTGVQKAYFNADAGMDRKYAIVRFFHDENYVYEILFYAKDQKTFSNLYAIMDSFEMIDKLDSNNENPAKIERRRPH